MPGGCSANFPSCQCEEKDLHIRHLKSQVGRLQSERLTLQATNLLLRERLDHCTQELEGRLATKENEVQTIRGTCRAMSSHVMDCEEKAFALQEELLRKEELLRLNSSFSWSIESIADCEGVPKHTSDISIQTSPRPSDVVQAPSGDSLASVSSSPRSETPPFLAEVQELRYTVQVLKEQLEEWQSVPNSPVHASSPARRLQPCASLADVVDLRTSFQFLDLPNGGCLGDSFATSGPPMSPISNRSAENFQPQVLSSGLATALSANEAMGRAAVGLEEECSRQALAMHCDWYSARRRLNNAAVHQLVALEEVKRENLGHAESMSRIVLQDGWNTVVIPRTRSSLASSVGEPGGEGGQESSEARCPREQRHASALTQSLHPDGSERSHLVSGRTTTQNQSICCSWLHQQAEGICMEEMAARSQLEALFETELLATLHRVLERRCGVKVCELWEDEQWLLFAGWRSRRHLRDATGRLQLDWADVDSVAAPAGFRWGPGGWELDVSTPADAEGWRYAPALPLPGFHALPWSPAPGRRRRWVRLCEPVPLTGEEGGGLPTDRHIAVEVFGESIPTGAFAIE